MSETQAAAKPRSVVSYLKIPDEGSPYLEGLRCDNCQAVFLDATRACAACGKRDTLKPFRMADTGKLYNFTVVHRNFPGVPVPFISAIVDIDGGGTLKGNLLGVEPKPEAIKFDMPVNIVIKPVPQKDKEGNSYLSYFFEPRN